MGYPANASDIGFALQSAKGSVASASQFRTPFSGPVAMPMLKTVEDIAETSGTRIRQGGYVSGAGLEVVIPIILRPKIAGFLLYALLGSKAVSGAGDPYTHTDTPTAGGVDRPWLTTWLNIGNGQFTRTTDCKLTRATIESAGAGLLQMTMTVMGLTPAYQNAAETTAAYESSSDAFLHIDSEGALLVEGADVAAIDSATIEIDNHSRRWSGHSLYGFDITDGGLELSAQTHQLVQSLALWNRLHYGSATPSNNAPLTREVLELAGSPAGLSFKWSKRDTAGAAVSPERSVKLLLPRLQVASIEGLTADPDPDAVLEADVNYTAYQPASGSAVSGVVLNGLASYAA